MYNEERKKEFISSGSMDQWKYHWAENVFNAVEPSEILLGKDVAEMSADEVSAALVKSDIVSSSTISNRVPFIARYKVWCADHGYPSLIVQSSEIHVDVSGNIRDAMVYSPQQLKDILEKSFPERSENDSKCIYKAHLWLGFAGMQDLDTVRVRGTDIDFRKNAVYLGKRMYYFSELGKRDIRHAAEMKVFERIVDGKPRTFRRMEGDEILRGRITKHEIDDRQYLTKTLRCSTMSGFRSAGYGGMSFIRIRKSGIFHEMFRREASGIPVNFYEVGYDDFVFDGRKATRGQTKQKVLRRIILGYEKDYEAWKRAFEPELKKEFGLDEIPHQFDW